MNYLDTNIFIYALEGHPEFGSPARRLIDKLVDSHQGAIASTFVLTELLRNGNESLLRAVEATPNLSFIAVDREIAIKAARLGREYDPILRVFDAIHVATAVQHHARIFWTNDRALLKLKIPSILFRPLQEAH